MKAIVLHAYGDPKQLVYEQLPEPQPGAGEVLIRVAATSLNPVDWKIASGALKLLMPLELPAVLGRDVVGEVTALGAGVSNFTLGTRVMGIAKRAHAEYVALPADTLNEAPRELADDRAGSLPLVAMTGAQLIERTIRASAGQTLLVTGALGSVGRVAVHVARQHGLRVLAGVRARQVEAAAELRADQVVALDDEAALNKLPPLDAVADTVGHEEVSQRLLPKLKDGGVFGTVLGPPKSNNPKLRVESMFAQHDPKRLRELADDLAQERFTLPIARVFRFAEVHEAYQLAQRGSVGKVVLVP